MKNKDRRNNYSSWGIKPLTKAPSSWEYFARHMIGWAILAANTHNAQPWRFAVLDEAIQININPAGILPVSDVVGRQATISVGCAIENIIMAAEAYGLQFEVSIFNAQDDPWPTGVIKFIDWRKASVVRSKIFSAIANRRINRGLYDPQKMVSPEVKEAAKREAKILNLRIDFVEDWPTKLAISEIQYFADKAVIAKTPFRNELGDWFLPNDGDRCDGMPGNTFGLSDEKSLQISKELKQAGPFDPDLAQGFSSSSRDGIASSPTIGIISVEEDIPYSWIAAGRLLQRILVSAETYSLSSAINAAIVEVEWFNKALRLRLKCMQRPTVIFRLGCARENRPHAPRMAPDKVIN